MREEQEHIQFIILAVHCSPNASSVFCFGFVFDGVSLCRPGWPRTCGVEHASSTSQRSTCLTEAWLPHRRLVTSQRTSHFRGLITTHRFTHLTEYRVTSQRPGFLTENWSLHREPINSQRPAHLIEDWSIQRDLVNSQRPGYLTEDWTPHRELVNSQRLAISWRTGQFTEDWSLHRGLGHLTAVWFSHRRLVTSKMTRQLREALLPHRGLATSHRTGYLPED